MTPHPNHPHPTIAPSRISRRRMLQGAAGMISGVLAAIAFQRHAEAAPIGSIDGGVRVFERADRVTPPAPQGGYDPTVRYVGIYGHPGSSTLGVLGTLSIPQAVERARRLADGYAPFGRPVVPYFEIIATVAAADAGSDGDYSNEFPPSKYVPHIEAATANGMQVLFDLQTGQATFPEQARQYEALWLYPNAHVALDPEWRFDPPGIPGGGRIGTVDATEVNEVIDYLDALIRTRNLPPKMLVIHQFTPSMVTRTSQIRQTRNVRVVMHMDGFGALATKRGSYDRMVADLPPGAVTGWKNFYDEDRPTPTPAETVADEPSPILISYQ